MSRPEATARAGSRTARGERRQAALLQAATELFLERGYAGTSLEDVIERAGGSRRTVYEAFGNKEGLFAASVEALIDRALGPFGDLDLTTDPPETALVRLGEAFVVLLTAPDIVAAFRVVLGELHAMPDLGRTLLRRGPERAYAMLGGYLARQAEAGVLVLDDPDRAARQLVEMMKADLHIRALLTPGWTPDRRTVRSNVESAVATFLAGARPRGR